MNEQNRKIAFEYAKSKMPLEACGLVIIENGEEVFVPCRNDYPSMGDFVLNHEDYADAEDRGEIIEVFHSHCYSSPLPSMVDKKVAESFKFKWSIISVPNGEWHEFMPTEFKAPLVGRQFYHGVLDCYSLIQDYYKEKLDMVLPSFDRDFQWWLKGKNLFMENFEAHGFKQIDGPIKEHDIILMQIGSPVVNHGGIYIANPNLMLHHLSGRLSTRDVYAGYYAKNTVKIIRHHSL